MNRVKFYLKNNDQKSKSIVTHIFIDTKAPRLYYFTKESIEPGQWDYQKQRARVRGTNKTPGAAALNNYLDSLEDEILSCIRQIRADNPQASYQTIKEKFELTFKKTQNRTFFEYFEEFQKIEMSKVSKNTYIARNTLSQKLKKYAESNGISIYLTSIDQIFWERFHNFLTEGEGLKASTCRQYLNTLKTFMQWTFNRGLHQNLEFKKLNLTVPQKEIIFLEPEELQSIINLDLSSNTPLDQIRDLFLFGCFTGARYSDISTINREDIKNNIWHLRTHKTKDLLKIPLNNIATQIINKYWDQSNTLPDFIIQKAIEGIKEVCKLAKIDTPVTVTNYIGTKRVDETKPKYQLIGTHTARRTFVTLSIMQGMKPETVMKITGHSDYKTMQKYMNITNKEAHKEYLKIWGDPNLSLVQNQ